MSSSDFFWMQRALQYARSAIGQLTSPNPRVGCIIVRDGRILGRGTTEPVGGVHAEIAALRDASRKGESTIGSTIYVTLEPCSYHGRTPPCVNALLKAKPERVVVAMKDPNPQVRGRGLAKLRQAGIDVITNVCLKDALSLNVGFVSRMTRGIPWVWLKIATSLDGYSALHNGHSKWITGYKSRADGHNWRARSCIILTGIGTIVRDNPRLNVRIHNKQYKTRKAVIDSSFSISESANLFGDGEVLIFTSQNDPAKAKRLAKHNARIVELPCQKTGKVDLTAVMSWLAQDEVNEIHVEAGARLNSALLEADCVDELIIYFAPILLGDAIKMLDLPKVKDLDCARRLQLVDLLRIEQDLRLRLRFLDRWESLSKHIANI